MSVNICWNSPVSQRVCLAVQGLGEVMQQYIYHSRRRHLKERGEEKKISQQKETFKGEKKKK